MDIKKRERIIENLKNFAAFKGCVPLVTSYDECENIVAYQIAAKTNFRFGKDGHHFSYTIDWAYENDYGFENATLGKIKSCLAEWVGRIDKERRFSNTQRSYAIEKIREHVKNFGRMLLVTHKDYSGEFCLSLYDAKTTELYFCTDQTGFLDPKKEIDYVIDWETKYATIEDLIYLVNNIASAKIMGEDFHVGLTEGLKEGKSFKLQWKHAGEAIAKFIKEEEEAMLNKDFMTLNMDYRNLFMVPITPMDLTKHIKDVIFNPPATIVLWKDGTKTVVKANGGDEYDPEKGMAMAFSKKLLGDKYEYYNTFKHYLKKWDKKEKIEKIEKIITLNDDINEVFRNVGEAAKNAAKRIEDAINSKE